MMYDVEEAFAAIEEELIASMIRNLDRHSAWEEKEGFQWEQWQALQLKALEEYKVRNKKKYTKKFKSINNHIESAIREAKSRGGFDQELKILEAIKKGKFTPSRRKGLNAEFFKLNERKLEALIKATLDDVKRGETAILRMANDKYRQVIFNAQVYANSGAATYEKAVDMATRDYLEAGLNCIEYKNGARHTLKDYADMALRTASKRAYLAGEGEKRAEWGIHTVIVNKRGNPCPKCLPFVGRVFIDDVWSGGSAKDGKYPLLSSAIEAGLYHPRCKDSHTTFFPGITAKPVTYNKVELKRLEDRNTNEQKQKLAANNASKYKRLAKYSLDPENKSVYKSKAKAWENASMTMQKGVGEIKRPAFNPAQSIKEAEEFASQFIDTSGFGSVGLSYKGVGLDVANELNAALNTFFKTFNVEKLGGLAAPAKNTKLGKAINAHMGYSPIRKSLILNRDNTKNVKTFSKALMEDKSAIEDILKHPENYNLDRLNSRVAKVVENSKVTGRGLVPETIQETVFHELGHFLEDIMPKKQYDILIKNMDQYATKISGYAADSPGEYIAESFASYMKGENRIDPAMKSYFDGLRK